MRKLYLTPFDQAHHDNLSWEGISTSNEVIEDFIQGKDTLYFNSAREGILYLMEQYGLKREDEVWITTTTESSYVSSCVTCSIFNFSKVSRVFTEKTKMIWIIHEFGFPHPRLNEIVAYGREKGIPVVEDIAHSLYSFQNNRLLGTFADYGLFSFPKNLPLPDGGVLIGNELITDSKYYDSAIHQKQQERISHYFPYMHSLAQRRREHYYLLAKKFQDFEPVYTLSDNGLAPFVFSFKTHHANKVYEKFDKEDSPFELQRTHVEGWVTLTTNPFFHREDINLMADTLLNFLDSIKS